MGHTEQKHKAVEWLWQQSKNCKTRPYKFTPTQVADAINGNCTSIGRVQGEIVDELKARGLKIEYLTPGNKRFFELR
jgi:hypothetical protein